MSGDLDLSACDREPIRIPGSIQPHGALFVLDPGTMRVVQAAVGDAALGVPPDPVGKRIDELLAPESAAMLDRLGGDLPEGGVTHLGIVRRSAAYHLLAHRSDGGILVELERAAEGDPGSFEEVYPRVREFLAAMQEAASVEALVALAATEVRRITGLDRALVYRFDEEWNGEVIAEDRNEVLPSYLGLRFPASDIPAQARELYRLNRVRLIADADYRPVPLEPADNPLTGRPTDLGFAVLRSVSPIHLEYMRNMGTMASMSISLVRDGALWGLISCHNRDPARVPFHVRTACDFIGQVLSMQIGANQAHELSDRRSALRSVHDRLLAAMARAESFEAGLAAAPDDLLALTGAGGAALVAGDRCRLIGDTPGEKDVRRIVEWVVGNGAREDLFATDRLAGGMPDAAALADKASGVLAIWVSQLHDSYLLWFRPELVRTVTWGGDPAKRADAEGGGRLRPRASFEAWAETVRQRSAPWGRAEIAAAADLRTAIVDIVLRQAEETAALSERLAESNKELEAFSYSVSHDLRAPFRHIVGYAELLKKTEGEKLSERGGRYVDTIIDSALTAGRLVDDLLSFSQMGRSTLRPVEVDMNQLVAEVRRSLAGAEERDGVEWRIGDLPPAWGDVSMLRLVYQNLIENALKFTRHRPSPVIDIDAEPGDGENVYHVRDNGAGFDMAYVGKLFGVFQRLHRAEEFEGTGIGLANVKRIVERHGGRVWAEGAVGKGAMVCFALPKVRKE